MANINTTLCNHLVVFSLVFVSSLSTVTFAYVSTEKPELEKINAESGHGYNSLNPFAEKTKEIQLIKIGVQGLIYCQLGHKLIPIEGAVARVTCLDVDENGYEKTPFSILSSPTDKRGYFFTALSLSSIKLKQLSQCKVFLNKCPLETCSFPTDVNKGISGALLTGPRHLIANKLNLYTVGPFVYSPDEPKPLSGDQNGY